MKTNTTDPNPVFDGTDRDDGYSPFGSPAGSQQVESIELEPILTPENSKIALACVLASPNVFADWLSDLGTLVSHGFPGRVAQATAALHAEGATVTMAAAVQWAWDRSNKQKFKDGLKELEVELAEIDTTRETPFVKENIERWLSDAAHVQAVSRYLDANTKFQEDSNKWNRATFEKAKEILRESLSGTPGTAALKALDAVELMSTELPAAKTLVEGLLEAEDVAMLGSSSKAYKSWMTLTLAICAASGTPWYGMKTRQSKVCLVNFELKEKSVQDRISAICTELEIDLKPGWLRILTLRGQSPEVLNKLFTWLPNKISGDELIVFDPIYQANVGKDENTAESISLVMSALGDLARKTGAAILAVHHYSKGNQSGKDMLDRLGGSGVFGRYLDVAITLTAQEAYSPSNPVYAVEFKRRSGIEPEAFCVKWKYPLLEKASGYDPERLKTPGRNRKYSDDLFLDPLPTADAEQPMSYKNWIMEVRKVKSVPDRTFADNRKRLLAAGRIIRQGDEGYTKAG